MLAAPLIILAAALAITGCGAVSGSAGLKAQPDAVGSGAAHGPASAHAARAREMHSGAAHPRAHAAAARAGRRRGGSAEARVMRDRARQSRRLARDMRHAESAPGAQIPVAFAHPALPKPVRARRVHGWSVTAVGDSVMLGSQPALDHRLPGIDVDAQVSRQFSVGLQVVAALASSGELRRIVVVGLGTNGTVTGSQIRQLMAEIGQHRRLVLVNTFEARPWEAEVNSTLAAAARRYRNVVLANWHRAIEHRTYLLSGDGVHPQTDGTLLYARVVYRAVQRAGNLPR
jgi:hypothetical protein